MEILKEKKKNKKKGGRDWKKGESGNPKGRPKIPEHVKMARKLNRANYQELVQKHFYKTRDQLKEDMEDPSVPLIELGVMSIIAAAIKKADTVRFGFLLDGTIGKVKEHIDLTTAGQPLNGELDLSGLTDKELDKMEKLLEKCQK